MAIYGIDFYGLGKYGPRVFLEFDAGNVTAEPRNRYGELTVSWSTPEGEWSRMRLVRNAYGVPVTEADGAILLDLLSGPLAPDADRVPAVRSYVDTGLEPGHFQYYAVWVFAPGTSEWVRAGETTGLVLKDHGYADRLWQLTPLVHRTRSVGLLDSDNEELRAFLALFGNQLDSLRGEYDTLLSVNDPDLVSGNLLPLMAQQYGQFYEPELGMRQMRLLLANSVRLYRTKGTEPGIEGAVSAMSGYGARLRPLKNLMLDYNDSSAEEDIGNWTSGYISARFDRVLSDGAVDAPAVLGSMRRVGLFRQTSTATGTVQVRTVARPARAIPVKPGTVYCFSGYARSGAPSSPAAQLQVRWMDARGTILGPDASPGENTFAGVALLSAPGRLTASATSSGNVVVHGAAAQLNARGTLSIGAEVHQALGVRLNAPGRLRIATSGTYPDETSIPSTGLFPGKTATQPLSTVPLNLFRGQATGAPLTAPDASFAVSDTLWTRGFLAEPAPAAAAWAVLGLGFNATAVGQLMYWDALQFEAGGSPTEYTDARLIDVDVLAPRVNLVPNPSVEADTSLYKAVGVTLSQSTSFAAAGTASLRLTSTGATSDCFAAVGPDDLGGMRLGMVAGSTYTVSATVNTPVALTSALDISRSIVVFYKNSAGSYVSVRSPQGPVTGSARVSLTFTIPADATEAFIRLYNGSPTLNDVVEWDAVLLEESPELRDYFDGSTSAITNDYMWEGTAHASRSHHYPQRLMKNFRLRSSLPRYTPLGSSFRLNYAVV